MENIKFKPGDSYLYDNDMVADFRILSGDILSEANKGIPLIEFLRNNSKKLLEFSECDEIEIRLKAKKNYYRCIAKKSTNSPFRMETMSTLTNENGEKIPCEINDSNLERVCVNLYQRKTGKSLPFITESGSFWTGNMGKILITHMGDERKNVKNKIKDVKFESMAMIPFGVDGENSGLLILKNKENFFFTSREINFYEGIAQTFALAIAHQKAQSELRERIKELTCLYGIARITEKINISIDEILQKVVELLPAAWQYPGITTAKITFDNKNFATPDYEKAIIKQKTDIIVNEDKRGVVEVGYTEEMPELNEGPFLKEERHLIDTIAKEIALIVEKKYIKEEKAKLREQLRHADRLATIGQLAAGVAHELNEPLANILGFAQLADKCEGLPEQAKKDIEKIKKASLHAREVVKKLLIFARLMPTKKTSINLNKIVEEGLYFLESRCKKEGIELKHSLSKDIPEITGDPSQLHQVLVNLVVNAIQAMPDGGKLTVSTEKEDNYVKLMVKDTGIGMDEKILDKLFVPFFTTKDVGEGTGLGLPVVHGIVTSHEGSIEVESEIKKGSKFTIKLPVKKT